MEKTAKAKGDESINKGTSMFFIIYTVSPGGAAMVVCVWALE